MLQLIDGKWYLDDEPVCVDFARAIWPVEFQLLEAHEYRKYADQVVSPSMRNFMLLEAEKLESSAEADAACEVKWGSRAA